MSKQIAVIGLGRFGMSLCTELTENGAEVLAIDSDADTLNKISHIVAHAVIADTSDARVIEELNLRQYACVFVSIGHDLNASILITLALKEAGVRKIWVKSRDATSTKILYKLGADNVLNPEEEMAKRISRKLLTAYLYDFVDLNHGLAIYEMTLPDSYVGKTLASLKLAKDIQLLAIHRHDGLHARVALDAPFQAGDVLVLGGNKSDLQRLLLKL